MKSFTMVCPICGRNDYKQIIKYNHGIGNTTNVCMFCDVAMVFNNNLNTTSNKTNITELINNNSIKNNDKFNNNDTKVIITGTLTSGRK